MGRPIKYKTSEERVAAKRLAGRLRNQRYRLLHPVTPKVDYAALDSDDDIIEFLPITDEERDQMSRHRPVVVSPISDEPDDEEVVFE
jgi:hypothetical protein